VSQENVERVRDGFDAVNRGDAEAFVRDMDPGIEWHPTPDFVDAGPFRGHEGVLGMTKMMFDTFESFVIEGEEFIDAGDAVVVPVFQRGEGATSGAIVEVRYVLVFRFHEAKLVRVDSYYDKDEALEAARLSE
jgi:ketosteroid isomerase-like protein